MLIPYALLLLSLLSVLDFSAVAVRENDDEAQTRRHMISITAEELSASGRLGHSWIKVEPLFLQKEHSHGEQENSYYRLITFQLVENKLVISYRILPLRKLDGPIILQHRGDLTRLTYKIPAGYLKSPRMEGYWCLFHRDGLLAVSGVIMI
jgi:hypothetical protein